uniref:Uncharacterized protein n=1 Tax=Arundo donax TaxID=35708 RepID=A0A0A9G550_ARUDO
MQGGRAICGKFSSMLQARMIDELHLASSKDLHGGNCRLRLIISMK